MSKHVCYAQVHEALVGASFFKAWLGCALLSASAGPLGCFLILRRMALMGDALSHGLLPGIALASVLFGQSLLAMSVMGACAGLLLVGATWWASQRFQASQDAVFAGFSLISVATGMLIFHDDPDELMHILFGSLATMNDAMLWTLSGITLLSLVFLGAFHRPLVASCFDADFFRSQGGKETKIQILFMGALTLNMMIAFQALGTLMALGFIILPALTVRQLTYNLRTMCWGAGVLAFCASTFSLLVSAKNPDLCGPIMVIFLGICYVLSLAYGESVRARAFLFSSQKR